MIRFTPGTAALQPVVGPTSAKVPSHHHMWTRENNPCPKGVCDGNIRSDLGVSIVNKIDSKGNMCPDEAS